MLGLQGKVAFVFGVASEDSIAWAICKSLAEAGVTLYLGYQKRFMSRVFQLKDKLPAIAGFYPLDVASDADTKEFFDAFSKENPGLKADIMIHAIGFAPRECFDRPILFVDDESINTAYTISANSLQRCLKFALPYLNPGLLNNHTDLRCIDKARSVLWNHEHGKSSIRVLDKRIGLPSWARRTSCKFDF